MIAALAAAAFVAVAAVTGGSPAGRAASWYVHDPSGAESAAPASDVPAFPAAARAASVFPQVENAPAARPAAPRIAVVFDDLGYSMNGLAAELLAMPPPLTFAVLPHLKHSRAFAEAASARGHEVILHLPMEPLDRHRHDPGRDALLVDLAAEENLRRLRRHLDGFAGYVGVSNHMGSRFTARPELMDLVLGEIRRRDEGLFFLDSHTTTRSAVAGAARNAGMPYLTNRLFLDGGGAGAPTARHQAQYLARLARERGEAVAIGHVRRETVDAVRAMLGRWEDEGIRRVRLSALLD